MVVSPSSHCSCKYSILRTCTLVLLGYMLAFKVAVTRSRTVSQLAILGHNNCYSKQYSRLDVHCRSFLLGSSRLDVHCRSFLLGSSRSLSSFCWLLQLQEQGGAVRLQLAHKCILNSFYGYVMRKG